MDFNEKLKYLRKNKKWTQEELAQKLFISRTAISKWESGRGFPNIESLKAISQVFDLSIDELLSNSELMSIAEKDKHQQQKKFRQLLLGFLDCMVGLLLFLPIFGRAIGDSIAFVTIGQLSLETKMLPTILSISVILTVLFGVYEIIFSNRERRETVTLSLILTIFATLLFIITRNPYPAAYLLMLLTAKVLFLLNSH